MSENKEIIEDENKIDTVIASDIKFKGTLRFKKSLKIKGNFEGNIETGGTLIIGDEAKVRAQINASTVSVSGVLHGKINATKLIEFYNTSVVSGDIVTPELYVEKGAIFNGTSIMKKE